MLAPSCALRRRRKTPTNPPRAQQTRTPSPGGTPGLKTHKLRHMHLGGKAGFAVPPCSRGPWFSSGSASLQTEETPQEDPLPHSNSSAPPAAKTSTASTSSATAEARAPAPLTRRNCSVPGAKRGIGEGNVRTTTWPCLLHNQTNETRRGQRGGCENNNEQFCR